MRLLAKSPPRAAAESDWPESVFLHGHLRDAHDAARAVLEFTGEEQLTALGLAPCDWWDKFARTVRLAAVLHDVGKANDHFQGLLQDVPGRRRRQQGLRHEWVGLLILFDRGLGAWLSSALNEDDFCVLALHCAITGHHPAYGRASPPQCAPDGAGSEMALYVDHPDFERSLDFIAKEFSLDCPPRLRGQNLNLAGGSDTAFSRILALTVAAEEAWDGLDTEGRRFVAAVKACLVASDVAGSALPKKISNHGHRVAWIRRAFARRPTSAQIAELVHMGLDGGELRPFQRAVAVEAREVTFVKAGCGTGKTLAAYHWASTRCPGKRIYFCYPTTGTATEGYRDYLFDAELKAGRFGADLFHGRADVDLDVVLDAERDIEPGAGQDATLDLHLRIESLSAWSTPIVSCTVDTVLGLVQNHRRGLYSWPALAGAAFVFDEIHSYDSRLFGAFLRFLESVQGVPVLLMTASMPQNRLEAIRTCLLKRGANLAVPARTDDLRELEELPRYRLVILPDAQPPLQTVLDETEAGGKVLWVCNTVGRAMKAAGQAERAGLRPIIYHSRFRYEDRVRRHKEVIDAFRGDGPAVAISTQVAEMSLDLSATLLVSDLAPVPALIQRLGRLNRRAGKGDPVRPFVVVEPLARSGELLLLPYDGEAYGDWSHASRKWLASLPAESISQADLAAKWEELQCNKSEPRPEQSAWLSGGPITRMVELRKGSFSLPVILERDVAAVKVGQKSLTQVILPMGQPPKDLEWKRWDRYHGVCVAPDGAIAYAEGKGARWL